MYERGPIPYYGGLVSFFRAPGIELDQVQEGMAVVTGVPIDNGIPTGRTGTRYGPRAIRESSLHLRVSHGASEEYIRFDLDTGNGLRLKENPQIADAGDLNIYPTDLMKTTASVIEGVAEISRRGGLPVVLGGDHYIAYPSFEGFARGMAERKSNLRLGYIHIDSHTDFGDNNAIGGRFTHGTCVRRISENTSVISLKNMAWVGINPPMLTIDQYRLYREHNLKMLTSLHIKEMGIEEAMKQAMETAADGVDAVYVSVDIDVVDASESPGTGAPEFDGILARDFLQIMEMLGEYEALGAIDLCEVAPNWDDSGRTVILASRGLVNTLSPRLFDKVEFTEARE
jgi:arginase family enzyme